MLSRGLYKVVIGVCLAVMAASKASGADSTLNSLIEVALQNNPDLHSARYAYEESQYRADATGWLPEPQLTVGLVNLPSRSLRLDETPMSGVVIGISQMIPWPGKLNARKGQVQSQAALSANAVAQLQSRLVRNVSSAYYDYAFFLRTGDVLERNLPLYTDLVEVLKTRYAHGEVSAQDVLRAQSASSRLQNRISQAGQQANSSLLRLAELVGDPIAIGPEIPAILPRPDERAPVTEEIAVDSANVWLRGAQLGAEAADIGVAVSGADYWPDLSVGLEYRFRQDHPMDAVNGEDFVSARFGLKLPLWFFGKQRNQKRAATAALRAAEARTEAIERHLHTRLADLGQSLQVTRNNLDRYDSSILPLAQAAYEAARVAYAVGRVDFDALLSAQRELLDIELEQLELLRQYHQLQTQWRELQSETGGA